MNIKFLTLTTGIICLISSCHIKEKTDKYDKAKEKSDYIMENFVKEGIENEFHETYFSADEIEKLLADIRENCDWENREGQYVESYNTNINGKESTGYVYEYLLACDSLRFVLIYDMEQEGPELSDLIIEPIEHSVENDM